MNIKDYYINNKIIIHVSVKSIYKMNSDVEVLSI